MTPPRAQADALIADCVKRYGAIAFRDFDCDLVPMLSDAIAAALAATEARVRQECASIALNEPLLWDVEWLLHATKKECSQRAAHEIAAAILAAAGPQTGDAG